MEFQRVSSVGHYASDATLGNSRKFFATEKHAIRAAYDGRAERSCSAGHGNWKLGALAAGKIGRS
jgi:hypothetical protein